MFLPPEIEFNIINYLPLSYNNSDFVCKSWRQERSVFRKKAVDIISNWYWNRLKGKFGNSLNFLLKYNKDICRYDGFLYFPLFVVDMEDLNQDILSVLPEEYKKSDVRDWLLNIPFTRVRIEMLLWMYFS